METIVGLFDTRDAAIRAIEALRGAGYGGADIGILLRDDIRSEVDVERRERREGMGESAAVGAFGGGVIGGLSGLLIGLTGMIIPGIGPALVAGSLAGLVGGAAVGAATGGLVGSLIELGVPHEQAHLYQSGIERGGVLVTINVPEGQAGAVRALLEQNGLRDAHEQAHRLESETPATPARHAWNSPPVATGSGHEGLAMAGGAAGGVVGGVAGGFVAGPAGAAIGAAIGAATGAMAGSVSESPEETAVHEGESVRRSAASQDDPTHGGS